MVQRASQLTWRKSSRTVEKDCVEVANGSKVLVRDSKNPDAEILEISRPVWRILISELKDDG